MLTSYQKQRPLAMLNVKYLNWLDRYKTYIGFFPPLNHKKNMCGNESRAMSGDFDVPSSREDVERDSVWNQWLTGHVPELFVNALQHFKVGASYWIQNLM